MEKINVLQDLKNYIENTYDPDDTLGIWYDSGNYDDAYELGQEHGVSAFLYYLGLALGLELDAPEYSDH